MRRTAIALLLMMLGAAEPVAAQVQSPVSVGATVFDLQGGEVGTVVSISGDAAVVSTGPARVTLGLTSFRVRNGRLTIGLTRAGLEEAGRGVQARGDEEVRRLLTPGANIYDRDGAVAATVESVDGTRVAIVAGSIRAVLPISVFARGPRGPQINGTAEAFQADLRARLPAPVQPPPTPHQE